MIGFTEILAESPFTERRHTMWLSGGGLGWRLTD